MSSAFKQGEEFAKWWEQWRGGLNGAAPIPLNSHRPMEGRTTHRSWLIRLVDNMKRALLNLLCLFFCLTALAGAQAAPPELGSAAGRGLPVVSTGGSLPSIAPGVPPSVLAEPTALSRMAPELALHIFERRSSVQAEQLASYSVTILICAQLPNTSQSGEYELQERYSAPRALVFEALRFTGDNFIKHNVILHLLQSEVEHLQKDDPALTAITTANYIFSYKGTSLLEGRQVHVYQLKPRHKRSGLFKGRILLDAYSGSLMRAEGRLVKSPSFFVKKIDFVQDFADIGSFTFPVHLHSEAQVRLLGRTIVDIYQHDYQPVAKLLRAVGSDHDLF
jgi:hypothetical protein